MIKTKAIFNVEAKILEPMEIFLEREYRTRTMKDIAKQISVSQNTLKSWADGFGIPSRTRAIPSREELLSKYQEKNSNQIAEEYGVTGRQVRNWMEKYEIARRVQMPSREELSAKCETKALTEIAEEYGVCQATVKNWKRNYGIVTKKKLPKKISEKEQADFWACKGRREYSPRIKQEPNKEQKDCVQNNCAAENNGREYKPFRETTLDNLIDFYNPLFEKDRDAALRDIFKNIMTKTGSERMIYLNLRNHYRGLEGTSV